ncbi:sugar phosphate isomerase/epimerase family protein [Cobetia amphilecti]|uniref:Sugar phosphate isomerase/epimerase family protein n=1 Tax=Cobetia amphilecti TaxID=1055104 RepID=A0AAP4TW08_9GAMM|nr:sugar phosphate isomerase/epimerase family protein [Cobetia amphilecti]MDO6671417.1 sugar phosphate isomerase/epimerase family protein [Cobetia amphilecti]MDO6814183.1 sugar phosphate isomerase/epimerase family protein [Cobetia amphilecti]TCJ25695.1 sugar phosphate isomerase/epimerase [Halomonas sp. GDM18]
MKLGVCTWTFGPQPIEDIFARVARLGFDGVELHGDLETFTPEAILALCQIHRLQVFSLTPGDCDPASPHASDRQAADSYYRDLIDFAQALGGARVSLHGLVGRIRAAEGSDQDSEYRHLVEALKPLCEYAAERDVPLVYEVLNRYESHLVNTAAQCRKLIQDVGSSQLKVLLDAYHMNIEEADPVRALAETGDQLGLYHVADSNRGGIGQGHSHLADQFTQLQAMQYAGPIIVEAPAMGPDPFTPVKTGDYLSVLEDQLTRSVSALREHFAIVETA